MILYPPSNVIFEIFGFEIYYYGIIMAISVLAGMLTCKFITSKFFEKKDLIVINDLFFGIIISGFLGARLYYVIAAYDYFINNLNEIFDVRNGGMSIHGALLAGFIFTVSYLKIKKISVLKYLDILTFGLIVGQVIGRWGNFFNSEAFGGPSDFFIKLYVPPQFRPDEFFDCNFFHPTFLYESVLNLILFITLLLVFKYKYCQGRIFMLYLIFYSVIRFFIEFIRVDSVLQIGNLQLAQIVSLIMFCFGITGLFILYSKNKHKCKEM